MAHTAEKRPSVTQTLAEQLKTKYMSWEYTGVHTSECEENSMNADYT